MSSLSVADYMKRLDQLASKSLTAPEILASASKRQPLRNLTDNKRTSDKHSVAAAKVRAERLEFNGGPDVWRVSVCAFW